MRYFSILLSRQAMKTTPLRSPPNLDRTGSSKFWPLICEIVTPKKWWKKSPLTGDNHVPQLCQSHMVFFRHLWDKTCMWAIYGCFMLIPVSFYLTCLKTSSTWSKIRGRWTSWAAVWKQFKCRNMQMCAQSASVSSCQRIRIETTLFVYNYSFFHHWYWLECKCSHTFKKLNFIP